MPSDPLFEFAVPDDLLREAVTHVKDQDVVADLDMMPGTGEGKPPPLIGILQSSGYAPLVLMTAAALVPGTFGNGITLIGHNLQTSFHMSNASLGAVAFIAQVSQLLWAVPLAVWADRGSRKVVAAVALLIFAGFGALMAISPNVWAFAFLYLAASVGTGVNNTVHNSYLADAYPTESRGRIFSWHNLSDPLSQTVGILIFGFVVTIAHDWRYGLLVALAGIPIGFALFTLREPEKGANESSHILKSSGMDLHTQQEKAPRVLLGSAVTRLLRIRSLYYELVAVAILGFAGTGAPLFGNLFFIDKFHLDTASRSEVYAIIGLAAFLGFPLAYVWGDRYFRKAPQRPLVIAGICITAYGGLFVLSLYVPKLWMVVLLQFLATAAVSPLAICIFLTLAATAPAEMRTICFAMFGVYSLVFGGFAGSVVLGAFSDAIGGLHGIVVSLTLIAPVCAIGGFLLLLGSRCVRRDITLVIEDVLERYAEGKRRQGGGDIPALQVHNLDFYYGTNQVLFDVNVEVAQGEMIALLGTNGAGKSTLLRTVSGLEHPHRGVVRVYGTSCTYLEPEQIIDLGVALLVGGKMTFPGLSVRDNLRIGGHTLRRDRARSARALEEALEVFPELAERMDQPAGTLSGGEQQMLALSRVMMTTPRLLMIDELSLGLAPMTVERLMGMVRRINESGTTVILVEQSLNRALSLADRCFFMERGEIRFDGPTAELMARDDLLRPVFLGTASTGLGYAVHLLAFSAPNFVLVQGVFYGLGYGLLALGLVLIYRTNRVLNFAQGQIGVIAAVFLVKLTADFGFNYWFALVLSIGLAAFVGALSELVLRRLFSRPRVLVMVATIGLSYVLLALTALPFIRPSNLYKPVPVPFDLSFHLGPFIITPTEVLTLIVAPIVTLALVLAVRLTPWGLSMRAMSENADSARLSGVWIRRTSTLTWTVAGALSAFTAILNAPNQTSALTQALSPDLLVYALTAALIGAMVNLTVAFVAGVGMGVFLELLQWNIPSPAKQQLIIFLVVMAVLLIRVGALRKGARTGDRSTWGQGAAATVRTTTDALRRRVSVSGVWLVIAVAVLLPLVLSVGNDVLMSEICIYAVVALSLTMLTGWAGQVSLGQFGLVAVGALVAVHLGTSLPLPLVMLYGGAVTAVVAILIGALPALRMPGLFLAVTTLAFAIFMQSAVLATPCITIPGLDRTVCTGLPNPAYTVVPRPSLFGLSLASQRSFAWFSLGVLVLSVLMLRVWRDKGVARRLVAVRDNELGAAALGIPILRTKLLAFALSGFVAGYAGVCLAFALQQLNNTDLTFDPTTSFVIISMVVIGGLGSISGAILGALYLEGLPALFGANQTIQFITSGLGLIAFILYLPGGLAELLHRFGDVVTVGVRSILRRGAAGAAGPPVGAPVLVTDGAEQ